MTRIAFKEILANKARLALTALAVVLGVAFISGAFVFSDTLSKTFDEVFETAFAETDVNVRSTESGGSGQLEPIPAEILPAVEAVDGVAGAAGGVSLLGVIPIGADGEPEKVQGPPQFGFSWSAVDDLNPFDITEGRPPEADDEVVIDAKTARDAGLEVGRRVEIIAGPKRVYDLVGVAEFGGGEDNLAGATAVLFTLPEIQRLAGVGDRLESIDLVAEDGVSPSELRRRVQAVLPPGVEAITGADLTQEQIDDVTSDLQFLTTGLLAFAGIAVFVSAFIIVNTFSITVAQRSRQLALLRAVGASGGQVTRMVVIEALVLGLVASLIGLFGGLLLAVLLQELFSAFGGELPTTALQFLPRTWVVAMVVGTGVTVIASVLPARRAAAIPPVAAMRPVVRAPETSSRRRAIVGGIVTAVGVALVLLSLIASGVALIIVMFLLGVILILVGITMLAAFLTRPLAGAIGLPVARIAGVPGRLGRENAMRNPARSAITAAALMVGLALVGVSAVFAASLNTSFGDLLDRQFPADLIVNADDNFTPFSPEAADLMRAQPAVGPVGEVRFGVWTDADGDEHDVAGVDGAVFGELHDPDFREGDWADLAPGTIVLSRDAADDFGVGVGDPLRMVFAATGPRDVEVAGVFDESPFGSYFIPLADYERSYSLQQDIVVFANPAPGADSATAQRQIEQALAPFPNLEIANQREFKDDQQAQVNQLLGLVSILLGLTILIAVFGIVNTLALSVFERTREIGLLRAVGLSPRQARRMIRYESVIVSIMGAVLGAVLGLFLGVVLARRVGGPVDTLSIPWPIIITFVVVAVIAGVLAAIFPARRASRLDVLRAIAHE